MLTFVCAIATGVYMYASVVIGIGDGKFLPLLIVITVAALGIDMMDGGE